MAPITLANGDETFGVAVHLIAAGTDTGPILSPASFGMQDLTNSAVSRVLERVSEDLLGRKPRQMAEAAAPAFTEVRAMPQTNAEAPHFSQSDTDHAQRVPSFCRTAEQAERPACVLHSPPSLYSPVIATGRAGAVPSSTRLGARRLGPCPEQLGTAVPPTIASRDRSFISDDVRLEDDDQ